MKTIEGKVKWGIIGAGDVCEKKSGPAFGKVANSELIAVMRRNADKAKDFAQRHQVPKYYTSVKDLLDDKEINAVYIATPPAYHEEYAIAAAKAGKQVYIEKPVTLDAVGCEKLIKTARQYKVKMTVAHYRRRIPMFLKVKELLRNNAIGDVSLINISMLQPPQQNLIAQAETNWRIVPDLSGGGLFHDLAPHQLDILCWFFGEPSAYSGYSYNQGGAYNAPDVCHINARFQCDIFFNGLWSFNAPEHAREDLCEIIGEKGKLRFSFFRNPILELEIGEEIQKIETALPETIQEPMIAAVVRYFKGETENPASLEEALWTMQLLDCSL